MTDQIMALGHRNDDLLDRILNRPRDSSEQLRISSSRMSDYKPSDNRWLSSERLTDPWITEEKWWLSRHNDTFLDTDRRVFGRRKVFLVDRKDFKSQTDIVKILSSEE